MSTEVKSIKETKEAVELALALGDAFVKAKADGKIGPEDLALLIEIFPKVGPAIDGADQIPAEIKDLSTDEAAELVALVLSKMPSVGGEKAQAIAEAALKAAVANFVLFKAISG